MLLRSFRSNFLVQLLGTSRPPHPPTIPHWARSYWPPLERPWHGSPCCEATPSWLTCTQGHPRPWRALPKDPVLVGLFDKIPSLPSVIFFSDWKGPNVTKIRFLGHLGQSKWVSQISISPIKSTMPSRRLECDWPPINQFGGSLVQQDWGPNQF